MQPIWSLLVRSGVDIVLSGHDHDYERFQPLDADGHPDPRHGTMQFVVGTGGRSLRPLGKSAGTWPGQDGADPANPSVADQTPPLARSPAGVFWSSRGVTLAYPSYTSVPHCTPRFACPGAVPEVGLEPTRGYPQRFLRPPRLPFRHSGVTPCKYNRSFF